MKLAKLNGGPEIFHTIQGEGVSVGSPAVFIRASNCNLHCHWCDTDHTWNFKGTPWSHEKDSDPAYEKHERPAVVMEITPQDAAERILAFRCNRTVITGGEPLLQQGEFLEMIHLIREFDPGHQFEVETNGTRQPTPEFSAAVDQFNVSPKLANSKMPESLRWNPPALAHLAALPHSWFKFVISEPEDVAEVGRLITEYGVPAQRILLMPEGRTAEELDRSSQWLAELCRDSGFRYCDRLHVRIWGDQKGV